MKDKTGRKKGEKRGFRVLEGPKLETKKTRNGVLEEEQETKGVRGEQES